MTVHGEFDVFERVSTDEAPLQDGAMYRIDETYWGYIVRSIETPSMILVFAQAISWLIGIGFLVATLGLWLMPSAVFAGSVLGMKFGATVVTVASASFCLWYASRGTDSEIQVDTRLGEVREVVRNRTGRSTLLGRYGFDAIGSVFIDLGGRQQRADTVQGALVLRYRNTAQTLHVASGTMSMLGPLRDRLGRDLMLAPRGPKRAPVPETKFTLTAA